MFFVIYINSKTVSLAPLINDTSISRATWMNVFRLVNIINEYWYESSFPLSQTDTSLVALTTRINIVSVFINYQKFESILVEQAIPLRGTKESRENSISCISICRTGLSFIETWQGCTDGHLREENSDELFHVMKYPKSKNAYLHKVDNNNKVIKNNHMRKMIRIMERIAISGLSTLLGMWNFKYIGNSSVNKAICGVWNFPGGPGTLWSCRPCWPVSHKA